MNISDPPPFGGGKTSRKRPRWEKLDFSNYLGSGSKVSEGRFLIAERIDGDRQFRSIKKFVAKKFLDRLFPAGIDKQRIIKDGHLLFEARSCEQARKAIGEHKIDETLDYKVKFSLHSSMNYSVGTFYTDLLVDEDVKEIETSLASQKVVKFERIKSFKDGVEAFTNRYKVTFDSQKLPEYINIAYIRFKIDQFYDNPLRCTKCQKFGHTKKNCRAKELCRECSMEIPHIPPDKCGPSKCVNCGGKHPSNSLDCPIRDEEICIKRIQTDRRISQWEAKREFGKLRENSEFNRSFSEVVLGKEKAKRSEASSSAEEITMTMYSSLTRQFEEMRKMNAALVNELQELRRELVDLKNENTVLKRELSMKVSGAPKDPALTDSTSFETDDPKETMDTMEFVAPSQTATTRRGRPPKKEENSVRSRSNSLVRKIAVKDKKNLIEVNETNLNCLSTSLQAEYGKLMKGRDTTVTCFFDPSRQKLLYQELKPSSQDYNPKYHDTDH